MLFTSTDLDLAQKAPLSRLQGNSMSQVKVSATERNHIFCVLLQFLGVCVICCESICYSRMMDDLWYCYEIVFWCLDLSFCAKSMQLQQLDSKKAYLATNRTHPNTDSHQLQRQWERNSNVPWRPRNSEMWRCWPPWSEGVARPWDVDCKSIIPMGYVVILISTTRCNDAMIR